MSLAEHERRDSPRRSRMDPHGIEQIPNTDRDSTPIQQFWI